MDFELQNQLRNSLDHHERLLWAGRPKQGFVLRPSDRTLIPFSLFWLGFSVFWMFMALKMGGRLFALFGVPFVIIGVYMLIGRFFTDMLRRKNTIYGITNDRIVIKSGIFSKELRSVNIRSISDLTFTEKQDGSGTILLGKPDQNIVAYNTANTWHGSKSVTDLELIPEVKKVYDILVRVRRDSE